MLEHIMCVHKNSFSKINQQKGITFITFYKESKQFVTNLTVFHLLKWLILCKKKVIRHFIQFSKSSETVGL